MPDRTDATVEHLTGEARLVRIMLNAAHNCVRDGERHPIRKDPYGRAWPARKHDKLMEIADLERREQRLGTADK